MFSEALEISTLDLLRHPLAFSQKSLLDPRKFLGEAKRRGVVITMEELQYFHRRRILQPFYEVHQNVVSEPVEYNDEAHVNSFYEVEVRVALREGRLSDPAQRRFRNWPTARSRRSLWYSYHQLSVVTHLAYWQRKLKVHKEKKDAVTPAIRRYEATLLKSFADQRSLATVLEILAPDYLPRVIHVARSIEDDWRASLPSDRHHPSRLMAVAGCETEQLVTRAEMLLSQAKHIDPLGKWSQVVRSGDARKWDELRYGALLAHEYRVAAEMLLKYVEDEAERGRAEPLGPPSTRFWEPRLERLSVSSRERATALMEFRLSTKPLVVLAVEGETEVLIFSRVLALAGFDATSPEISIVNLKSINGDVKLLARSIAVPLLDPARHELMDSREYTGVRLLSPLTSLIVIVDPEGNYKTAGSRGKVQREMIDEIMSSMLEENRSELMRSDLGHLVEVRSWPAEFEFAHWSDTEIAKALQAVSVHAASLSVQEVARQVAVHRRHNDGIRRVWTNWSPKPSKVRLADHLWPVLEHKINASADPSSIPIVEVVQDTIRMMHRIGQATMMRV